MSSHRGLKGGHSSNSSASHRRPSRLLCADTQTTCGGYFDEDYPSTRPKGLKNVGNTCYANATLQCLLNTALSHAITDPVASAIFRRYSSNPNILAQGSGSVDDLDENGTTTTGTSSTTKNSLSSERQRKILTRERKRLEDQMMHENCEWLTQELRQLTLEYHTHSSLGASASSSWLRSPSDQSPVDPGAVTRFPHRLSQSLTPYLQEDAHEFLRAFLGTLVMHGRNKELSSLFDGLLESNVTCQTCYRPSLTRDRYMDLSLNIADPSIQTLSDALSVFTNTELLSGENSVYCRHCECKRIASKGLRLATAPSILVCHFKRFAYDEARQKLVRLRKKVTFPLKLEIGDFMSKVNQARPPPYELVSVLVHQGNSCEYGHYVAYVKHSGLWYKCNDSNVEPVNLDTVLNQQAYILMYEVAEMREKNGFGCHSYRNHLSTPSSRPRSRSKSQSKDLLSYYTSHLLCGMEETPLFSDLCHYSHCWRATEPPRGRKSRRSGNASTTSSVSSSRGAMCTALCHGDDASTVGDSTVESTDTKRRFRRSSSSGNLRDVANHYAPGHSGPGVRGSSTGRSLSVSTRHRRQNSNQTSPGNLDKPPAPKLSKASPMKRASKEELPPRPPPDGACRRLLSTGELAI
jgi:ubiquitin C-terminal hydrolase